MTKILAIAQANLVRTARDRMGLFFIVVLPLILIVVLGITYGGQGSIRIGVADADGSALSQQLVDAIGRSEQARIELREYASVEELGDAASRGFVAFGIAIPAGYDAALRSGDPTEVEYVAPPTTGGSASRQLVERAVAAQDALVRAARFAAARTGADMDAALDEAASRALEAPGIAVEIASVSEAGSANPSGFSIGAQSQLILFMFLTSLTGAVELITTRQLGISRRMAASPTGSTTIILGEGLGRLALALFQGAFIVVVSAFVFDVDWADPIAMTAIVVIFAFVCAGSAMLVGTLARNASQAGALGPALGMALGLLGGTMVPPEVFPDIMQTLSHATPHAWAMDGFRSLLLDDAGIVEIAPQLAVLVAFAIVLVGLAAYRFRRLLATGAI
ncbi:MAG TPA: ABC transporter permease [Candidatus Limnocylindrales bacterium]|nr:ABC transporter permease [Candidatus Limnocylindrales bacterium]